STKAATRREMRRSNVPLIRAIRAGWIAHENGTLEQVPGTEYCSGVQAGILQIFGYERNPANTLSSLWLARIEPHTARSRLGRQLLGSGECPSGSAKN